jgi:hypothetical protein
MKSWGAVIVGKMKQLRAKGDKSIQCTTLPHYLYTVSHSLSCSGTAPHKPLTSLSVVGGNARTAVL